MKASSNSGITAETLSDFSRTQDSGATERGRCDYNGCHPSSACPTHVNHRPKDRKSHCPPLRETTCYSASWTFSFSSPLFHSSYCKLWHTVGLRIRTCRTSVQTRSMRSHCTLTFQTGMPHARMHALHTHACTRAPGQA